MRYANGPLLTVQTGANPFEPPPPGPPPTPQGVLMRYPGGDDHVLSGLMRGANEIRNRPAIVDQPSGKGRVILFAGNPCYRWQNFGEFNLLFNTVLNFNDIKTAARSRHRQRLVNRSLCFSHLMAQDLSATDPGGPRDHSEHGPAHGQPLRATGRTGLPDHSTYRTYSTHLTYSTYLTHLTYLTDLTHLTYLT